MLLVGAIIAATLGLLLGAPTLRLRGDYLAIVTLGFGEIVPAVFLNASSLTKGTNGIGGIYKPELFGFKFTLENPVPYYVTMVAILAVTMVLLYRLQGSRLGRAWMAVREDELAAASSGINTITTKLLAFALGASTAGLAGVFATSKLTFVGPGQFGFQVSFTVLAMVVLGGMGNIWGVATGAFVIYTIQAVLLKELNQFFQALHVPDPPEHRLRPVPVPALRRRPGGDDAAPARGPLPEQSETAGAPRHLRGRRRRATPDRGARRMTAATIDPPPGGDLILQARKVTKAFGGLVAVKEVDLEIPAGAIVSLIGPNGAGKTTFFNVIAGILDPTSGVVEFGGRRMVARPVRAWLEPVTWVLPAVVIGALGALAYQASPTAGLAIRTGGDHRP